MNKLKLVSFNDAEELEDLMNVFIEAFDRNLITGLIEDKIKLVKSPDGHSLAYMEEKGLLIADLPNNTRSLLWENDLEKINQDPPDITLYVPVSWSADQDWLVIWTSWWEGGRLALGSITSKNIFPLSGCSDTSWSPNGATLGMVVRYSGYLLCGGDNDGIYVVETTEGEIEEKLIYQESSLSSPPTGLSGAAFIQWSPDGHLMFVQENENLPQSSLILLSPDGTEINTLVDLRSANGCFG